jgi:O-methyltransferase involved in polyketide biosynthesis
MGNQESTQMISNRSTKVKVSLGGVEEALMLSVWARVKENEKDRPYVVDAKASEIIRQIEYDFGRVRRFFSQRPFNKINIVLYAIRDKYFDAAIEKFISAHPKATVVNIGAGLDMTFYRVDNGSIRWYDVDLPDVIDLRCRLVPETARSKCIAKSVLDFSWLEDIAPAKDGLFLFAGNVLGYFDAGHLKRLFSAIATSYPGAEIIFDCPNMIGRWFGNQNLKRAGMKDAPVRWATSGGKEITKWGNYVEVVDEWPYFSRAPRDPSWTWDTVMLMRLSDWFKLMKVIHLRFR